MTCKSLSIGLTAALVILAVTVFVATTGVATENGPNTFNTRDGIWPYAGLMIDASGNLYGTTISGGTYNYGSVFELTPKADGGWRETVPHSFNGKNGYQPYANLTIDGSGNLYGTTLNGGAYNYGTAFELMPKGGGGWTEEILHNFNKNGKDGYLPYANLVIDGSGNLYGTTQYGGAYNWGTVFELMPKAGGGWMEKILHNFNENGRDGMWPYAGLIIDASGNLYGTTAIGGAGLGTVFELMPKAGGGWTEKVLHAFNGKDGFEPYAGLIIDASGNLYGTTSRGGGSTNCTGGCGTVFELTPKAGGGWKEKVLHAFNVTDGNYPYGGLTLDASGNLYSTTVNGGSYSGGTVFELTPRAVGGWKEKVLHSFNQHGNDGFEPFSGLIIDGSGNLYGTTYYGGVQGWGAVFELMPKAGGRWTEKVVHSFNPN